ncbi:hypothetical protein FV226_26695 [Methylobacterium sp. WL12]|uniref:hypothetical protein n=1 Tax=Methylobacterium sp. WL12 TaxID=2603890 RepID=UPI0011C9A3A0|nr:hypothetical protein [Methylobacterium sp. WL12]TXM64284.1 hypothetical protein FV226_26695 [Methylobacterium sp. WL12]
MTHITPRGPRAHATDHAVRRYAERFLGETVEETVTDDRVAVRMLKDRRVDTARIRARIADVGGVIMATGRTSGDCIAFPEALRFRLVEGKVVTVLARAGKVKPTTPEPAPARARCVLDMEHAS